MGNWLKECGGLIAWLGQDTNLVLVLKIVAVAHKIAYFITGVLPRISQPIVQWTVFLIARYKLRAYKVIGLLLWEIDI